MEVSYKIKLVTSEKDKDLTKALDIYVRTVDEQSETETNQIRDYIANKYQDERLLFFYILYADTEVVGFAEYGFLPSCNTLIIDYLCTEPRNHTFFYNFYTMIFNDINERLNRKSLHIKYIITELSLKKNVEKEYIDVDSNYFRQLLTMEHFKILKAPYFQPALNSDYHTEPLEFNLAIKPLHNALFDKTILDKNFYLYLIRELYNHHYLDWYVKFKNEQFVKEHINALIEKIEKEYPKEILIEDITSVNCHLLEQGLCKQVDIENITVTGNRKKRTKKIAWGILNILFAIATLIFCIKGYDQNYGMVTCSFFTIISAIITCVQFYKN